MDYWFNVAVKDLRAACRRDFPLPPGLSCLNFIPAQFVFILLPQIRYRGFQRPPRTMRMAALSCELSKSFVLWPKSGTPTGESSPAPPTVAAPVATTPFLKNRSPVSYCFRGNRLGLDLSLAPSLRQVQQITKRGDVAPQR